MTTTLVRPLSREVLVNETVYKVTLTTEGLILRQKGHRKGMQLTWDELLAASESLPNDPVPARSQAETAKPILGEIVRELRTATAALARANDTFVQSGELPAALLADFEPDPIHGRAEQRSDWLVEPLLTIREVASILRLSTTAVRRLPLRTVTVGNQVRYRQSAVREFLREQESQAADILSAFPGGRGFNRL